MKTATCLIGTLSLTLATALALALQSDDAAKSAAEAKPLKVGVMAPKVSLQNIEGKRVSLKSILDGKPTVLVFYRGGWCPFCNTHLSDLAKVEGDLKQLGYQLIAITPDKPEEMRKTVEKRHLSYQLFSDTKADALKKFGVAFRVDDQTFTMYRDRFHIDMEGATGETHHILPVPSVFILDRKGQIVFVHSNPDYKVRLKGDDVVAAAKAAQKQ